MPLLIWGISLPQCGSLIKAEVWKSGNEKRIMGEISPTKKTQGNSWAVTKFPDHYNCLQYFMQRSRQGFVAVAHHFCLEKVTSFASKFSEPFLRGGLEVTIAGTHCLHPARWGVKIGGTGCCLDGGMAQQFWAGERQLGWFFIHPQRLVQKTGGFLKPPTSLKKGV